MTPTDLKAWAEKRYAAHHRAWLNGEGNFPLKVSLGAPTEKVFMAEYAAVLAWHTAWQWWDGPGTLCWTTVNWQKTGAQRLPTTLELSSPAEVAALAGKSAEWVLVESRLATLAQMAPAPRTGWGRFYDLVLAYDPDEWLQLLTCLAYFLANPSPGLYRRQLPIPGIHTKWIEAHEADVTRLVAQLKGLAENKDFHSVCGLRKVPYRVRVRLLCPRLRQAMGGLGDLKVPLDELKQWSIRPQTVLFVENLESGIALEDHPGTLAFIGMGNAVTELAAIPWLAAIPGVYWGDVDTFGLAMYARLAARLPLVKPVLMDEHTLWVHRPLWTQEPAKSPLVQGLPEPQQALFDALQADAFGPNVRLEQERIPWAAGWRHVSDALAMALAQRMPSHTP